MEDGDCRYYCCRKCKGLFEELDVLVAHKLLKCDGKVASSDCELFACERKQHVSHVLQQDSEEPKITPVRSSKRRRGLVIEENETPSKKKAKQNQVKKLMEKKERVKRFLQDVTANSTSLTDSPTGRRSSGRVRNMPVKYKDFAHELTIKKEPEEIEDVPNTEPDLKTLRAKSSKKDKDTEEERTEYEKCITDEDSEVAKSRPEEKIELELDHVMDPTQDKELEQPYTDADQDVSFSKDINDEIIGVPENVPDSVQIRSESQTESGVEIRTRRLVKIKAEDVIIKDEPDTLIKEIFDGEIEVKKPNVLTKEQKEELAEKYKQYYRIVTKKKKSDKTGVEKIKEEQQEDTSQEVKAQGEDAENVENEDANKDSDEDDGKEKENQTNRRMSLKRKHVKKKVTSKSVSTANEEGSPEEQWHYHCPVCVYSTRHVGFFEHHMTRAHDNGKVWTCDKCEYTHPNKGVMRLHRNAHVKPFMCEYCSHKFSTGIDLKKHRYIHTGETPYKCTECDWAGRQKKALKEHMRKHTGDKLKCTADGCDFETYYKWALEQHRRSKHEEGNRYQCAECPYATSDSGSFCKHRKYHQGVKDYRCSQCSYKGVTKNDVIKHMRIHTHEKIYFCDRCQYSSCHSSAFKAHMMSHLGLKSWQCKLCGFSGTTRAKIIRHLENKHRSNDKTNAVNLPTKLQLNFDDFKIPHDASSQANIVYEVIEAVESSTDETGAIVVQGEEGEMSVVTHVDPNEFQGLAGLAAASEAAAAQERTVTQIIVQRVDPDGNPTEEQQHIDLSLPPGGVVSLPGGVVSLPPGVVELPPGRVVTTNDGSNITLLQGQWPGAAETITEQSGEENVVETFIIEQPASDM